MKASKAIVIPPKLKQKLFTILYVVFFLYLCLVFWEVFLGPYRSYSGVRRYNLYPFRTIINFLYNRNTIGFHILFINIIANIVFFMPLGFFIPMLFKKFSSPKKSTLLYCFIIICIELGQFILNVGVLDIDDFILNTLGCLLGFVFFRCLISKISM